MNYLIAAIALLLASALGWLASASHQGKRGKRTQQEQDKCLQDAARIAAEVRNEINAAFDDDIGARLVTKAGLIIDATDTDYDDVDG